MHVHRKEIAAFLNDISLSCTHDKDVHTKSSLSACVQILAELGNLPDTQNKVGVDVCISSQRDNSHLYLSAICDKDICLSTQIIDVITNILLLWEEEGVFALASEEGVLVDIRERVVQL